MEMPESAQVQIRRWVPSECHAFRPYVPPSQIDRPPLSDTRRPPRLVVDSSIVIKLTKEIIDTYKCCNPMFHYSEASNPKRYLTHPSVPVSNGGQDNENHDLILAVNGVIINSDSNHRYIIKDLLGQGTFGQVAKCLADEMGTFVAVKIIKNQPAYRQQAVVEIGILKLLNGRDPEDNQHIVRIFDHFFFQEHLCIVFEMLGMNLYELLKANHLKGLSLKLIRNFTKQILTALTVLRDASVIHCDLKPENILLTIRPESAEVKLIDFGSACKEHRTVYSYIQSRFYRSPEVVIGHEYTTAIDMWSFGCVVAELFLGLPLFPAQSQYDLMQRMIKILGGKPPDYIIRNAKNANKYFKPTSTLHSENAVQQSSYQFFTPEEYEAKEKDKPIIGRYYFDENWDLEKIIMNYPMKRGITAEEADTEKNRRIVFMDFLRGLVNFDPLKRWSPRQAMQHPFVTEEPFTGPFNPPDEPPRMPIHHGMTVDHHPGDGHWFGAGLSPQVNPTMVHFGSPQFHGYQFSYGSSFGSVGSFSSYGEGLANSYGSYGDPSGVYLNNWTPSSMVNTGLGMSPDARRRMGHFPPNVPIGPAHLGISPGANPALSHFINLGASPNPNFTPPNSHFQSPGSPSTGSPSRYGPTSPARGGGAASLGKVAAFGQFHKRRGSSAYGSPGSSGLSWHGPYQSNHSNNFEGVPHLYPENYMHNNQVASPRGSSHLSSQLKPRSSAVPVSSSVHNHSSKSVTCSSSSLGTVAKTQATLNDADDPPTPSSGDGNPDFSEALMFEPEAPEATSTNSISTEPNIPTEATSIEAQGSSSTISDEPSIRLYPGQGPYITRPSGINPIAIDGSPHGSPHILHNTAWRAQPQISPSRLGQHQQLQFNLHQQQLQLNLQQHVHLRPQQIQYPPYHQIPHHFAHDNFGNQYHPQGQWNGPMNGAAPPPFIRKDRRNG